METQQASLDREVLQSLKEALEEELDGIIEVFIGRLPPLIQQMQAALTDGDPKALHFAAHALKGAASNFGAKRLHELCTRLEVLADAGDLQTATGLFHTLQEEAATVERQLTREWLSPRP